MGNNTVELSVFRLSAGEDTESHHYDRYEIEPQLSWSILDALNYIKDEVDSTLTYRWSCQMSICGSCGLKVNGEPVLACSVFLRDYDAEITIEPLDHFPVQRDLAVDVSDALNSMQELQTWLIPHSDKNAPGPNETFLQTPRQFARYHDYTMCINCMLCYSACPQYGLDSFLGPAALALAQRYNKDSRDAGRPMRLERAGAADGVWRCTLVGTCSEVCPKDVKPASAVQELKLESVLHTAARVLTGKKVTLKADKKKIYRETGEAPTGTEPRARHRKPHRSWFLHKPHYKKYMLREITAFFMTILMLVTIALTGLPALVETMQASRAGRILLAGFLALSFPFFLYHSLTWFAHTPKIFGVKKEKTLIYTLVTGMILFAGFAAALAGGAI